MTENADRADTQLFLALDGEFSSVADLLAKIDAASPACLRLSAGMPDAALAAVRDASFAKDIAVVLSGALDDAATRAGALVCDGIEVPASSRSVKRAFDALNEDSIVGARATDRHDGMEAAEAGASYVLIERGADGVDVELVRWWAAMITTPIVVDGVTPDDVGGLVGVADFISPAAELSIDELRKIAEALA